MTRILRNGLIFFLILMHCGLPPLNAEVSEIIPQTQTQIIVREHPKTGKPYPVIVAGKGSIPPSPIEGQKKYSRPDYRLLDPKIKSGQIPYDGPHRNNMKIYILAASLAAAGAASGAAILAAPAVSTGGAAGGAGLFTAGGAAVAAGTAAAAHHVTRIRPEDENFSLQSETRVINTSTLNASVKEKSPEHD